MKFKLFEKINNRKKLPILESLSPRNNLDKDKFGVYYQALNQILKNKNNKNIGITGAFGSGKSSIINSYLNRNKFIRRKSIKISLASFEKTSTELEKNFDNHNLGNTKDIEVMIIQQLLFFINKSKLRYSRFSRINNQSSFLINIKSLLFSTLTVIGFYLLIREKITNYFYIDFSRNLFYINLSLLFFILFFIFIFFIIKSFFIFLNKGFSINKVKINNSELEFLFYESESNFNKYIDEIMYFFDKTKIKYMFIEDLDRFNNPYIFVKLREINYLINNRKNNKKIIRFIYVLSDNFFQQENRVKFFDVIIPIIPVITSNNSKDILLRRFKEIKNETGRKIKNKISIDKINNLSFFIDDMRILNNLINEFFLYINILNNSNIDYEKLFGIIIYKNYFPSDYVKLNKNLGIVANILKNKKKYIEKCKEENLNLLNEKEKTKFDLLKNDFTKDELIDLFWMKIENIQTQSPINNFSVFTNDGKSSNIKKNTYSNPIEMFDLFINSIDIYINLDNGLALSLNEEDDKNKTKIKEYAKDFKKRYEIVIQKNDDLLSSLENEIILLKDKNLSIDSWKFSDICNNLGNQNVFHELFENERLNLSEKNRNLIIFLIRNDMLDETYPNYLTYFHEEGISFHENEYVVGVFNENIDPKNYTLYNLNSIIDRVNSDYFSRKEILNLKLIDFLINNTAKDKYINHKKNLYNQLQNGESSSINFIINFLSLYPNQNEFYFEFSKIYDNLWEDIHDSELSKEIKDNILFSILMYVEIEDIKKLNKKGIIKKYIENMNNFLYIYKEKNINDITDKIEKILLELKIKFNNLLLINDCKDIINIISSNNFYEINENMIVSLLNYNCQNNNYNFYEAPYSTILESCDSNLIKYIKDNMHIFIEMYVKIYSYQNVHFVEKEEHVLDFLNNSSDIRLVENFMENINIKISLIKEVKNSIFWHYLFETDKIEPNWENIFKYKHVFLSQHKKINKFLERNVDDIVKYEFKYNITTIDLLNNFYNDKDVDALVKKKILINVYSHLKINEKTSFIKNIPIFSKILDKEKRIKINIKEINANLLELLKKDHFISSFKQKNDYYIVYYHLK